MSWARYYATTSDLLGASDVVALGTFDAGATTSQRDSITFTDSPLRVERVLRNTTGAGVPRVIRVRQTGGSVNGVLSQIEEDPIYVPGERVILFLKYDAPGLFHALNPEGRFEITGSNVTPGSSLRVRDIVGSTPLDTFVARLAGQKDGASG